LLETISNNIELMTSIVRTPTPSAHFDRTKGHRGRWLFPSGWLYAVIAAVSWSDRRLFAPPLCCCTLYQLCGCQGVCFTRRIRVSGVCLFGLTATPKPLFGPSHVRTLPLCRGVSFALSYIIYMNVCHNILLAIQIYLKI
jgi:hypothetical protein